MSGRLLNGATFGRGEVSLGFTFDGTNDSVRIPARPDIDIGKLGDGSLTMEFWASSSYRGNVPVLAGYYNGTAWGTYIYHHEYYGELHAALIDTAGARHEVVVGGEGAGIGWRHYALTYNKSTGIGALYINGQLAAKRAGFTSDYDEIPLSAAGQKSLKPGANTIAIHCHQTTGGQYIDVGLARVKD